MRRLLATLPLCLTLFATEPNDATRRWWAHVVALANDGLAGRDTGSEGYRKAARYVATEFERDGLKPAGEAGYFQSIPLHVERLRAEESQVELVRDGAARNLQLLRQITVAARVDLPVDRLRDGLRGRCRRAGN